MARLLRAIPEWQSKCINFTAAMSDRWATKAAYHRKGLNRYLPEARRKAGQLLVCVDMTSEPGGRRNRILKILKQAVDRCSSAGPQQPTELAKQLALVIAIAEIAYADCVDG